ncbi:NAD-dependent dehydratase [Methylacidimicrobium sp. AP8]|uniref:UDP-glucuronic acid decarboxylase family protein n=1 Tax=Methylacidimicrobium sp. AP8 TaxID=2730359 RepID=UPI0018C0E04B|nr:UDP-glucuronic acid decarboxylase family protein [Methylacidimicrobium sp. AP8]CAB4244111.1 NAD-dependent dehydratase [Methylacidimicrobium sp. AP8]
MPFAVVTGAAGFLGSHLVDRLLEAGYEVLGIDNFVTGNPNNLAHLKGEPRFHLLVQDVTEYLDIPGKVDQIFHLASPASPVDYLHLPIQTLKAGALGTYRALGLAKAKGAAFLLASTSEIYGDPLVHPQNEEYWGNVNPIGPRGVYDEAKRFAEALTMAYHRTHGVRTHIVRIFNTYGPRMRLHDGRVVPAFIGQALEGKPLTIFGDGSQTRSFCYCSDLIEGIFVLAQSTTADPVNIGNPTELSILEFARIICRLANIPERLEYKPLPVDDPKQRRPDISRAQKVLGWRPKVDLETGLRETIAWFRAHRPNAGKQEEGTRTPPGSLGRPPARPSNHLEEPS